MKIKMSFFQVVLLIFNLIFIALLLCSYFAAHTYPETWWPFHLLGLGYIILLSTNLLFVIIWLLQGHVLFLAPLFAILIGWPQLTSFFGTNFFPENEPRGIKIMTYNVRNFDLYKWNYNAESRGKIIELIKKADPDIICFQEYYSSEVGEYQNLETFRDELKLPYYHIEPTFSIKNNDHWGIATFSKFPITTKKGIRFPNSQNNAFIYSDIDVDGKIIRVFNLHLQSIRIGSEDFESIEKLAQNRETDVQTAKILAGKLRSGFIKRYPQANMVKKEINATDYPVIVCGDFNATPTSYSYKTIVENMQDAFLKKSWGIGNTYVGIIPALRIDYILLDNALRVNSYERYEQEISDHLPVMVSFEIIPDETNRN